MMLSVNLYAALDAVNVMKRSHNVTPYDDVFEIADTIEGLVNNLIDDIMKSNDRTEWHSVATGMFEVTYRWVECLGPVFRVSIDVGES